MLVANTFVISIPTKNTEVRLVTFLCWPEDKFTRHPWNEALIPERQDSFLEEETIHIPNIFIYLYFTLWML